MNSHNKNVIEKIAGSWTLEKFEITNENHLKREWRNNYSGILIYEKNGYMSVSINGNGTIENHNEQEILFYAGKFTIGDNNLITHTVLNASSTNRIGKTLERKYAFRDNKLVLNGTGKFGKAKLIWKRPE
jgi:hypothetical protein